jgi:hypothetical protein
VTNIVSLVTNFVTKTPEKRGQLAAFFVRARRTRSVPSFGMPVASQESGVARWGGVLVHLFAKRSLT